MASGQLKDISKALKVVLNDASCPQELPPHAQQELEAFLDKHKDIDEGESQHVHNELLSLYSNYVSKAKDRTAVFLQALGILQPVIIGTQRLEEWWKIIIGPIIDAVGHKRVEIENASIFVLNVLNYDMDEDTNGKRAKESARFTKILLDAYLKRTRMRLAEGDILTLEDEYIARQIEVILIGFGKKKPKDFLIAIDRIVVQKESRMQALGLLSIFVRHQPPHLYVVSQTPLIEHLLKCLMIDTSTTVISIALTILIMFLPHIPSSVMRHLPRLFLIYARILCWERASPANNHESTNSDLEYHEDQSSIEESSDDSWDKLRAIFDGAESSPPELVHYFTFLYGLYPLNFTSFVRKPRKYLKAIDFPRADDFDLDQSVLRSRTEQYRRQHLLHPNFYNTTAEDELTDNRWLKSDPGDVVAECMGLSLAVLRRPETNNLSSKPPPSSRLPDLPVESSSHSLTSESNSEDKSSEKGTSTVMNELSTVPSEQSQRTSTSPVLETVLSSESADVGSDSPLLSTGDVSLTASGNKSVSSFHNAEDSTSSLAESVRPLQVQLPSSSSMNPNERNLAFLQREVLLLKNDLNFERYIKQQHLSHIGELQRRNIREATAEAETQNLITTNRSLKVKLARANESYTILKKETATGRTQSKKYETELSGRVRALREDEKRWRMAEENLRVELKRVHDDCDHLRRLLVERESKDLLSQQKVASMTLELEEVENLRSRVQELEETVRDYQGKELAFEQANDERDVLRSELATVNLKVQSREGGNDRERRVYDRRISELEAQLQHVRSSSISDKSVSIGESPVDALSKANAKYMQLRKEHIDLRYRFVELELRCQELEHDADNALHPPPLPSQPPSVSGNRRLNMRSTASSSQDDEAFRARRGSHTSSNGSTYLSSTASPLGFNSIVPPRPTTTPSLDDALNSMAIKTQMSNHRTPKDRSSGGSSNFAEAAQSSRVRSLTPNTPGLDNDTGRGSSPMYKNAESAFSVDSLDSGVAESVLSSGSKKVTAKSNVRVYGRGGAQNIGKDGDKEEERKKREKKTAKTGGFRGLRGIL